MWVKTGALGHDGCIVDLGDFTTSGLNMRPWEIAVGSKDACELALNIANLVGPQCVLDCRQLVVMWDLLQGQQAGPKFRIPDEALSAGYSAGNTGA